MTKRNKIVLFQIIILIFGISAIFQKMSVDSNLKDNEQYLLFQSLKSNLSINIENNCAFLKSSIKTNQLISIKLENKKIQGNHSIIDLGNKVFLSIFNLKYMNFGNYPFTIYMFHNAEDVNFKCFGKLI